MLEQQQGLGKTIQKELVAYKRQDQAKDRQFNLKFDYILQLKKCQQNRCAACNIEMLWGYQLKDTQQFSVDRLDNNLGHCKVRLCCLDCNRKRGSAALIFGTTAQTALCHVEL